MAPLRQLDFAELGRKTDSAEKLERTLRLFQRMLFVVLEVTKTYHASCCHKLQIHLAVCLCAVFIASRCTCEISIVVKQSENGQKRIAGR